LPVTASPSSNSIPGPPNEVVYAQALSDEGNQIINPVQAGGAPLVGAPVNAVDTVPTEHRLEEVWTASQSGGAEVDGFVAPSTAEQASLNTALKGMDLGGSIKYVVDGTCIQTGAGAPVNEIGTDINTSALYEPARGEPTFTIANPFTYPPIQRGGSGSDVEPTPPVTEGAPAVTTGTEIRSVTFNEPASGEPTFTVANPYTSPPVPADTSLLPGPQAATAEAMSTFEVPKSLQAEVATVVQQTGGTISGERKIVFDDADVKVIRIE
jgi:hypothetical protein